MIGRKFSLGVGHSYESAVKLYGCLSFPCSPCMPPSHVARKCSMGWLWRHYAVLTGVNLRLFPWMLRDKLCDFMENHVGPCDRSAVSVRMRLRPFGNLPFELVKKGLGPMRNRTESLCRRACLLEGAVGHHSNPKVIAGIRIVQGVVSLRVAYSSCITTNQYGIESSSPIVCN